MTRITVVPSDNLIMKGGEPLVFEFALLPAHASMHALQWHGEAGEIEWTDGRPNSAASYAEDVAYYVELYGAEKARLEAEEAERERQAEDAYNSTEARAERLRSARDAKLAACDFRMCADVYASMSAAQQTAWTAYRQALRDLPSQEGFPWDGGGEQTPWPAQPE